MSYERSFVIGVFGRELLKRQILKCDGGVPDRLAGQRIRFARAAGYKKITLWTHVVLKAARAICVGERAAPLTAAHRATIGCFASTQSLSARILK